MSCCRDASLLIVGRSRRRWLRTGSRRDQVGQPGIRRDTELVQHVRHLLMRAPQRFQQCSGQLKATLHHFGHHMGGAGFLKMDLVLVVAGAGMDVEQGKAF